MNHDKKPSRYSYGEIAFGAAMALYGSWVAFYIFTNPLRYAWWLQ